MGLGIAGIVNENDVAKQLRRGMIEHRVDGSQERRKQLLMEDDDDGSRQPFVLLPLLRVLPKVLLTLRNGLSVVRNAGD